jgi:hypothetical protein
VTEPAGVAGVAGGLASAHRANVAQDDVAGRLLAVAQRAEVRCGGLLHGKAPLSTSTMCDCNDICNLLAYATC